MTFLVDYFDSEEILEIIEMNPDIKTLEDEYTQELINILKDLDCDESSIKDIIYANPFYLNRFAEDLSKLIEKLKTLKIENLNEVFTGNPWLLDRDDFEIDEFIEKETKKNTPMEDIIETILVDPSF